MFETASDEKVVSVGVIRDADDDEDDDNAPELGPDAGSEVSADNNEGEAGTPDIPTEE